MLIALVCVSCNKPRFAGESEGAVTRYIKLETTVEKFARSDEATKFTGVGVLSLQPSHPLQRVECLNCIDNGTLLTFEKQTGLNRYEAKFNFSYVQTTQACKLDLSALYADDPNSPINKSYSLTLCPIVDNSPVCDENAVLDDCSNIKTASDAIE
ncbi:MAG: hypothetical protein OYH77_03675 [Pseudomonadota bacterium]|nr:hypothetical protein [Pseudomonadota bacterium]